MATKSSVRVEMYGFIIHEAVYFAIMISGISAEKAGPQWPPFNAV